MFGIEDFSSPIVDFSNFEISQLGSAAAFGGGMLLVGMLTVFAVLCLLWLFLVVFKFVFHDLPKKRASGASDNAETVSEVAAVPAPTEDEIVAVIAAAIAMAESENTGMKFRVVSFKRK